MEDIEKNVCKIWPDLKQPFPEYGTAAFNSLCRLVHNALAREKQSLVTLPARALTPELPICAKHVSRLLLETNNLFFYGTEGVTVVLPMMFPEMSIFAKCPMLSAACTYFTYHRLFLGLFRLINVSGRPQFTIDVQAVALSDDSDTSYAQVIRHWDVTRLERIKESLRTSGTENCYRCTPCYMALVSHARSISNKNPAQYRTPEPFVHGKFVYVARECQKAKATTGKIMKDSAARFHALTDESFRGTEVQWMAKRLEWLQETDSMAILHGIFEWTARLQRILEHAFYFDDTLHKCIQETWDMEDND